MDDNNTVEFFDCNLCDRKAIRAKGRINHHKEKHRSIPYQVEHYKYVETRFKRFKCNICCDVVERSKRGEHQAKNHSQFKNHNKLYSHIWMVEDLQHDLKVLNQGEYGNQLKCQCCKVMVNQSDFLKHIQQNHPFYLKSIDQTSTNVSQNQSAEMMRFEDIKKEEKYDSGTNVSATENEVTESQAMHIQSKIKEEEIGAIPKEEVIELNLPVKKEKDEPMNNVDQLSSVAQDNTNSSAEKKFECNVCAIVVDESDQEDHRQLFHSQFRHIRDLFEAIFITHDQKTATKAIATMESLS